MTQNRFVKTMKASELIKTLQNLSSEYGDCEVDLVIDFNGERGLGQYEAPLEDCAFAPRMKRFKLCFGV